MLDRLKLGASNFEDSFKGAHQRLIIRNTHRIAIVESGLQVFQFCQIVAARLNPSKLCQGRLNHVGQLRHSEESIPASRRGDLFLRTRLESMEHTSIHRERVKRNECC